MARYRPQNKDLFIDFLGAGDLLTRDLPGLLKTLNDSLAWGGVDAFRKKLMHLSWLFQECMETAEPYCIRYQENRISGVDRQP